MNVIHLKLIVVAVVLSAFSFNSASAGDYKDMNKLCRIADMVLDSLQNSSANVQPAQTYYCMSDSAMETETAPAPEQTRKYLMFDGKFPIKDLDSMAEYLRSKGYEEGESLGQPFFIGPVYGFRNCRIDLMPKHHFDKINLTYIEKSLSLYVTMASGIKDIATVVDFYKKVVDAVIKVEGNPDDVTDEIDASYGNTNEDYLKAFSEGDAYVETCFDRALGEISVQISVDDITNTYEVILLYRQI